MNQFESIFFTTSTVLIAVSAAGFIATLLMIAPKSARRNARKGKKK